MEINLNKYTEVNKKAPPHELSASVNEIIKIVGESKTYNYGYWLRKVKNVSYSKVLGICKEAGSLDAKYNKGGFITNSLRKCG